MQAPIDFPTDIGLLADSVRVVTRSIKRALAAVGRSLRMRTGEAKTAVLTQTARVLRLTRQIHRQAQRVLRIAGSADRTGRDGRPPWSSALDCACGVSCN